MRNSVARIGIATLLLTLSVTALDAHDLFLRLARYFVPPNATVDVHVLNGTFSKSEASVDGARLRSLDLRSPHGPIQVERSAWKPRGDSTTLTITTGAPGTYVVGASLDPRTIRLSSKEFNEYLRSDGLPDILAKRRHERTLGDSAHERYEKHVKAIFQVGDAVTDGYDAVLGYPAELVPLDNPYRLRPGSTIRFRALVDGRPVANQYILSGGRTARGRSEPRGVRTDSSGVARVRIPAAGTWYVKFIHMVPVRGDSVNYESKWASVSFAVR